MNYNTDEYDPVPEEYRQKRLARPIPEILDEWEALSLSDALDHIVANTVTVRQNDLRDILDYLQQLEKGHHGSNT